MICWLLLIGVIVAWCWVAWRNIEDPFDVDSGYPEHDLTDPIPEGFNPGDTQPTSPGLLDTLPGKLE